MLDWLPLPVDSIRLDFDECSLGNPGQLGVDIV